MWSAPNPANWWNSWRNWEWAGRPIPYPNEPRTWPPPNPASRKR